MGAIRKATRARHERIPKLCIFAIIVLASVSRPTTAQTVDGNLLVSWCDANINRERVGDWAMKGGSCLGYLLSIVNIQTSGAAVGGKKACIPPNVDMNQIVDVFRGYVRERPEKRHLLAANLAAEAFALAFPCRP
ncbi:Rap1a/Tai family immunity protein [Bradyrhizobium sp. I1.7.5]|uniref:Rap1a/Tai family immunity protein n=1 Tax=Bradyrhizobium sp. I1.7.5 TaxID=3156363 RepID=UPI00339A1602